MYLVLKVLYEIHTCPSKASVLSKSPRVLVPPISKSISWLELPELISITTLSPNLLLSVKLVIAFQDPLV
jgi:hypothetical protein